MNDTSRTDWKKLSDMQDEQIDTSDIPELDEVRIQEEEFKGGRIENLKNLEERI